MSIPVGAKTGRDCTGSRRRKHDATPDGTIGTASVPRRSRLPIGVMQPSRPAAATFNDSLSRRLTMTNSWNADAARAQYAIAHWGENYFDVDDAGRLVVRPRGAGTRAIALDDVV